MFYLKSTTRSYLLGLGGGIELHSANYKSHMQVIFSISGVNIHCSSSNCKDGISPI